MYVQHLKITEAKITINREVKDTKESRRKKKVFPSGSRMAIRARNFGLEKKNPGPARNKKVSPELGLGRTRKKTKNSGPEKKTSPARALPGEAFIFFSKNMKN